MMRIGLIFLIIVLAFAVIRALRTHFVCPRCSANFKVGIVKYIFTPQAFLKRMVQCPYCGHHEFMLPVWDKK